jgi:hypothetical protein
VQLRNDEVEVGKLRLVLVEGYFVLEGRVPMSDRRIKSQVFALTCCAYIAVAGVLGEAFKAEFWLK